METLYTAKQVFEKYPEGISINVCGYDIKIVPDRHISELKKYFYQLYIDERHIKQYFFGKDINTNAAFLTVRQMKRFLKEELERLMKDYRERADIIETSLIQCEEQ